jgi:predicted kinase
MRPRAGQLRASVDRCERRPTASHLRVAGSREDHTRTAVSCDRTALRLTQDEWLIALGSSPWDASTREKVDHELWRLAQEVLRLGLSVVLDFGLWARIERDEMRSVARGLGVAVELHYLDVPTDELWRRIQARNFETPWNSYPIGRADFDEWLRIFQAPDAAELALFDPPPDSN